MLVNNGLRPKFRPPVRNRISRKAMMTAAAVALGLVETQTARATSYTWSRGTAHTFSWNNYTGNGDTSSGTNWTVTAYPQLPGDIAILSAGNGGNLEVVDLDQANISIGALSLGSSNSGVGLFEIASGSNASSTQTTPFALTFNNLTADATVTHVGTNSDPILAPVVIAGDGNLSLTAASGGSINYSGGITSGLTTGTQLITSVAGVNLFTGALGNGTLGGTISLNVSAGTAVLSAANTYTGLTTINGSTGILELGYNTTTGTLSTISTIVDNGTLAFNRSNAVVQGTDFSSSAITGTGGVTLYGASSLTLNAANTYTGTTLLGGNNETVFLKNVNALGGTATLNIAALTGTTIDIATNGVGETAFPINSGSGFNATIVSDLPVSGPGITHALGLATVGGGTLNIAAGANVSGGSPAISFTSMLLSSGTGASLTIVPTTANAFITAMNASNTAKTVFLDGTSTGNTIGTITQNAVALSVTKSNTSTWTITGSSTYTGATSITGGTLALGSGATLAGTSAINSSSGAVFDISANPGFALTSSQVLEGNGTIKGNFNDTAGTLAPGSVGTTGTLAITGSLNLAGGTVALDLNGSGTPTNDLLTIGGNLLLGSPSALSLNFLANASTGQSFTVMTFNGSLSGSISNLAPVTRGFSVTNTSNSIVVTVTSGAAASLNWNSSSSGAWDVVTSPNWYNIGTGKQDLYYQGDSVTFGDSLGTTLQTAITLNTSVTPGSVTVTSNSSNYTISGTGSINGSTGLTMTGTSVLTLATNNGFTGAANIASGTVLVTGTTGLGTGALTIGSLGTVIVGSGGTTGTLGNSSIVDNGVLAYNLSGSVTPVAISGSGLVKVNVTGTAVLAAADSYSGGTNISAGTVAPLGSGAFGTGPVYVASGGVIGTTYAGGLVIPNTMTLNGAAVHTGYNGPATFSGAITLGSNFTLNSDGNSSLILTGSLITSGYSITDNGNATSSLTIATNSSTNLLATNFISNGPILNFAPPAGVNYNVSGTVSGSSELEMTGGGTTLLASSNTYTGGTYIANVLIAANNNSFGVSTANISMLGEPGDTASMGLEGGITISNPINPVGGRSGAVPTFESMTGNNTLASAMTLSTGGSFYNFQSDAGSTLTITGTLNETATGLRYFVLQGAGNGVIASPVVNGSATVGVVMIGTGTWNLSGGTTYTGVTQVSSGTLVFAQAGSGYQAVNLSGGVNVGSGALVVLAPVVNSANRAVLSTPSLILSGGTSAWTSKLDVGNNDLDIPASSTWTSATNLSTVFNQVAQGYNNGTWNSTGGIVSSVAAASTSHLTALGVIQNSIDQNGGNAIYTSFDGLSVSNTDVLVKYTYYGDTNLDGEVDGTDYSRIDNGALNSLTGWFNGDFNYDGVINGSDYTLIDNAFNTQGAQIQAAFASATAQIAGGGSSAVPEPTTLSLLGISALGVLRRRRRIAR